MCYLDNAATSFPKPKCVVNAAVQCIEHYCGNPGRSGHALSMAAAEKVYEAREQISDYLMLGAPENICFTANATHALNIAVKAAITEPCHCIISDLEHNSVIRPLKKIMKRFGGEISVFNSDLTPDAAIRPLIRDDTRCIITTLSSNVTGRVIDIGAVEKICKEKDLRLIVDASQYIGHKRLDMSSHKIDFLCAPGHKALFGLQGSGFIAFGKGVDYDTLYEGGSGSNSLSEDMPVLLPERFEAGTLATPSIISLGAGVKFLTDYGTIRIEQRIRHLTDKMEDIVSSISGTVVYGCENGICSFNIGKHTSNYIANELNLSEIYVRAGLHCAPIIHRKLGTVENGAVRASVSILTTDKELDRLYKALKRVV